jgi:hypothetical protein
MRPVTRHISMSCRHIYKEMKQRGRPRRKLVLVTKVVTIDRSWERVACPCVALVRWPLFALRSRSPQPLCYW